MTKLPDAQSLGFTAPQPDRQIATYQGGIAQTAAEQVGGAVARAGQDVSQVGADFQQAQDQVATSAAENNFLQQKLALDKQFSTDQDYSTKPERYGAALADIVNQQAATIKNVALRTDFTTRMTRWQAYGVEDQQRQAQQQSVAAARAGTSTKVAETIDSAANTNDQSTKDALFNSTNAMIDGQVKMGAITPAEAIDLKAKMPREAAQRYWQTQVALDPAAAARALAPNAAPLAAGTPTGLGLAIHSAATNTPAANEDTLARTAQMERGEYQPVGNPASTAAGPFGFIASTAHQYGVTDPNDPVQSANAAARLQVANRASLMQTLGRAPTEAEVDLAHEMGAAGAAALIQHPDLPAPIALGSIPGMSPALVRASIVNNGGKMNMSAGDFAAVRMDRFAKAPGLSGSPSAPAPTDGSAPLASNPPSAEASATFAPTGDDRDLLPPNVRAQLYRTATDRAREGQAVGRVGLQSDLKDLNAAALAGQDVTIPGDRIKRLLPPDEAVRATQQLQVSQHAGQLLKSVQWGTPDQVNAVWSDLSTGLGPISTMIRRGGVPTAPGASPDTGADTADSFRQRAAILGRFEQLVAERSKALSADPAGYVAANPTVASAAQAIDPAKPETFEAYARATAAVQKSLGVTDENVRVLSVPQAQAQAQKLLGADPSKTDVGAALDGMAGSYGQAWPQVWHDLVRDGHMPGDYQVLAQMPQGPDRINMQRALQAAAAKGGVSGMRKDIDPKAASTIDAGVDGALDDFRRTVIVPGVASDIGLLTSVRNAVTTSAYYNAMAGMDGDAALSKASSAALPYDFEGAARAPKGLGSLASATGASVLEALKPGDLSPAAGGVGMTDADRQTAYLRGVQRAATWLTNERGDGWVLAARGNDGSYQFPLRKDGSRVGFRFSDMDAGATPPAPEALPPAIAEMP